jgi:hypothetical protein
MKYLPNTRANTAGITIRENVLGANLEPLIENC